MEISNAPIKNRVDESGLITFNLEDYYPLEEIVQLDVKPFLFRELIIKEKEFRAMLQVFDFSVYHQKRVAIYCSTDAIIPYWSYMLIGIYLAPIAKQVCYGTSPQLLENYYQCVLSNLDLQIYKDQRIVIKGCSQKEVPVSAYLLAASLLQPIVKSIMYGEPCSTVPLYKKKNNLLV
jgi:hypothetical protein